MCGSVLTQSNAVPVPPLQDGRGGRLILADWDMAVRNRGQFGSNPASICGSAELSRITEALTAGEIAVHGVHERRSTVIVPGFDLASCPLSTQFTNYRRVGRAGDPDITFKLQITHPDDPDAVVTLGEDTFVNADTGKLSLTLDSLGRFNVTLQAKSGDQLTKLLGWQMHVREGPNGQRCDGAGHGGPSPADDAQDRYSCTCALASTSFRDYFSHGEKKEFSAVHHPTHAA